MLAGVLLSSSASCFADKVMYVLVSLPWSIIEAGLPKIVVTVVVVAPCQESKPSEIRLVVTLGGSKVSS